MKKTRELLLTLALAGLAAAQQKTPVDSMQEDCGVTFSFPSASSGAQASGTVQSGSTGTTAVLDNRQVGCTDWVVTYSTASTVSAITLRFQTASNVNGNPGTWGDYPGTLNSGINPNTAAVSPWAFTVASGPSFPFLRMNLTALTGTGPVTGKLYGWKRRPTLDVTVTGGGGCPGTISTPCVVEGLGTPGAQAGGVLTVQGDPAGTPIPVTNTPSGTQDENLIQIAGNAVVEGGVAGSLGVGGLGAAGTPTGGVLTVQGDPAGTPIPVTNMPAGTQDVNLIEIVGTPVVTGGLAGTLAVGGVDGDSTPMVGKPVLVGGYDNTGNIVQVAHVDTAGNFRVVGVGTAGSPFGGVLTVQGDAAGTPIPVADASVGSEGSPVPAFATYVAGNGEGNLTGIPVCTRSAFLNMTTATTTALVAPNGTDRVAVCSIAMEAAGTTTATLVYGTGVDCVTGTNPLGAAWEWTTQTGISRGSGLGGLYFTVASQGVCMTNSANVNLHVEVTYTYLP